MTKEEYIQLIKEETSRHNDEIKRIKIAYAKANNPYKIGDVIADSSTTIRIDKIQYGWGMEAYPYCVYTGVLINKTGEPNKKLIEQSIFQNSIK